MLVTAGGGGIHLNFHWIRSLGKSFDRTLGKSWSTFQFMILGSTDVPKCIVFQLLLFIYDFDNEDIIIWNSFYIIIRCLITLWKLCPINNCKVSKISWGISVGRSVYLVFKCTACANYYYAPVKSLPSFNYWNHVSVLPRMKVFVEEDVFSNCIHRKGLLWRDLVTTDLSENPLKAVFLVVILKTYIYWNTCEKYFRVLHMWVASWFYIRWVTFWSTFCSTYCCTFSFLV